MSENEDKPKFPDDDLRVDFGEVSKTLSDPNFMERIRRQKKEDDARCKREMQERAQRARADAIASFETFAFSSADSYICPSCKAVVMDREQHLDWHSALNATAAAAHEASWRMRPIG